MHDKLGTPIVLGDEVVILGKVVDVMSIGDGTFCSVNVEIEGDWDGMGGTSKNWFATKQVQVLQSVKEVDV